MHNTTEKGSNPMRSLAVKKLGMKKLPVLQYGFEDVRYHKSKMMSSEFSGREII